MENAKNAAPNIGNFEADGTLFGRETSLASFGKLLKQSAPPIPKDSTPKNFRVLLIYPNYMFVNLLPTNIGILTSCLRQNGFEVDLFDTTFYKTAAKSLDEIRVEHLQLRKFTLSDF